jgi:hypothetical protein
MTGPIANRRIGSIYISTVHLAGLSKPSVRGEEQAESLEENRSSISYNQLSPINEVVARRRDAELEPLEAVRSLCLAVFDLGFDGHTNLLANAEFTLGLLHIGSNDPALAFSSACEYQKAASRSTNELRAVSRGLI